MGSTGRLELDRPVDAITVGVRYRDDLGDIDALAASIDEHGLLQPITISPDGTLICGRRRLAAVQRLGWTKVNVWVRSGISTQLEHLLAEQHENTDRLPYNPIEAAALYRELKALMAEDAARCQEATRFGADHGEVDGGADSATPSSRRRSRAQAARAVTGRNSYTRLEQVGELEHMACDPALPADVRQHAARELDAARDDGKVHRHYASAKAAAVCAELDRIADDPARPERVRRRAASDRQRLAGNAQTASAKALLVMADNALARATSPAGPSHSTTATVRRVLLACQELRTWIADCTPDAIAAACTTTQWQAVEETAAALAAFTATGRDSRVGPDGRDHGGRGDTSRDPAA